MLKTAMNLMLGLIVVCCVLATDVSAQGAAPPVMIPANVVKQSRPFYVEGVVVVALMAAAGFAVCRSSRRV